MNSNVRLSLRAARVNAGLTQKEAAELLLIGVSTLQGYESGRSIPRWDMALRMEALYGVPCGMLLTGPDEQFRKEATECIM